MLTQNILDNYRRAGLIIFFARLIHVLLEYDLLKGTAINPLVFPIVYTSPAKNKTYEIDVTFQAEPFKKSKNTGIENNRHKQGRRVFPRKEVFRPKQPRFLNFINRFLTSFTINRQLDRTTKHNGQITQEEYNVFLW